MEMNQQKQNLETFLDMGKEAQRLDKEVNQLYNIYMIMMQGKEYDANKIKQSELDYTFSVMRDYIYFGKYHNLRYQ